MSMRHSTLCFSSAANQFIQSHGDSLFLSFGFQEEPDVYLFSYYAIDRIDFSIDHYGQQEANVSIRCSGPTIQSKMSDLDLDLRAARDLSVDELMKVVYNKLQQRSES